MILLEFLVPDSQKLIRQSPLGFSFVRMGKKISIAFVLEVYKNGDNQLPVKGTWMKVMQFSTAEIVNKGDRLKMCLQKCVFNYKAKTSCLSVKLFVFSRSALV